MGLRYDFLFSFCACIKARQSSTHWNKEWMSTQDRPITHCLQLRLVVSCSAQICYFQSAFNAGIIWGIFYLDYWLIALPSNCWSKVCRQNDNICRGTGVEIMKLFGQQGTLWFARVVCNREDTLNYINFRAYVQTVLVQQFLSNDFVLTWEYSILFCLGIDRNSFLTNFCFKYFSIIF